MEFSHVLGLIGGLALFLLGMKNMADGLEKACGNRLKGILERLTSNRFIGVLVGMVITMVIQSSSATTVMVVGFVNAGMMSLTQAVWVIMGANIGTTITGQLVALDVGMVAPIFAIIGVGMVVFTKKQLLIEIGHILSGFGILFIGMGMMSDSMMPLRDVSEFVNLMTSFKNPILGILAGMLFTAVIQSSSASIGILQGLAMAGVISLDSAVYVLFGQNLGTCITAVLASIGANRAAKRTTLIHLMFNLFGTIIFTSLFLLAPGLISLIEGLTPGKVAAQIANTHTLFNIATTLILLPFGTLLVKLAAIILPDKEDNRKSIFMYLSHDLDIDLGSSAMYLENTRLEVNRMLYIAKENIISSFDRLLKIKSDVDINKNEDLVDELNKGIINHITKCMAKEGNSIVSQEYSSYLTISNNIERLSDHALNILEHSNEFDRINLEINPEVESEIINMKNSIIAMLDRVMDKSYYEYSVNQEEIIDSMSLKYRLNMLDRLKRSNCSAEGSIIYSSILIDFERIGDHLLNISEEINKINL